MTIKEISDLRKTQDNGWHCTSLPLYLVEKKVREYGLDSNYCDEYVWIEMISGDHNEVTDPELIRQLEDAEYIYPVPEDLQDYEKVYYRDRWEFVTLFFTENGANDFIEKRKHNYVDGLRVNVDSAHRNEELKEIIKFLETYP